MTGDTADKKRGEGRIFLVVVDETEEMHVALCFAARRASRTGGRLALLYVIEPSDFQHWQAVDDLMQDDRREEAENLLLRLSNDIDSVCDHMPLFYIRAGSRREELLKLIEEEPDISILILGASPGKEGPGPLISYLSGRLSGRLRIPFTIVPGGLTDEQLEALT
jgi:nucleotide-binding universal stress UspA family protein